MNNQMKSIPVRVSITRLSDSKTVEFEQELYQDLPDYDGIYIWEDGNYSCDCNRALFFARAASEDEPNETCGHRQYKVNWIKNSMGEVLCSESA